MEYLEKRKLFEEKIAPLMDDLKKKTIQEKTVQIQSPTVGLQTKNNWNAEYYIGRLKEEFGKKGITIDSDLEKMIVDKMVICKMPKNSMDYILQKGLKGSLFNIHNELIRETELDKSIQKRAEALYNPTKGEWIAATATSSAIDMAFAPSLFAAALDYSARRVCDDVEAKKQVSATFDHNIPMELREKSKIEFLYTSPQQQLNNARKWCEKCISHYQDLLDKMDSKGTRSYKDFYGNSQTYESAQQKLEAYKDYASKIDNSRQIPDWMYDTFTAKELKTVSDKQLTDTASSTIKKIEEYEKKLNKSIEKQEPLYDNKGKVITLDDADILICQYRNFYDVLLEEKKQREKVRDNKPYTIPTSYHTAANATENISSVQQPANSSMTAPQNTVSPSQYTGWDELFKKIGFTSPSNLKSPGLALANLPDALFGMFTGGDTSFGLNRSTLIPLAAIIASFNIKSPLLKLLLLGFGGVSLLSKSAEEANGKYQTPQTRYKTYDDQQLSQRLKDVRINGNVLLMDVDGVPCMVSLSKKITDAYNQGALPLNTIANNVLSIHDQQKEIASRNYNQQQSDERMQGISIK